ncbi:MAG: DUF262 domain-containing protein [Gallionella sp.]|nr:DUF262 domain-containing protein [Gallionella sp.]
MEITFDRRTVSECLQQSFALPTYQRDYKWEHKHLRELLSDIQEAFFVSYKSTHGRTEVKKYPPYFLGTIITTPGETGAKSIVDGQQRITSLAMLVAYFNKLSKTAPALEISDIEPLLRKKIYGQFAFNIGFDDPRAQLFNLLAEPNDKISSDEDFDDAVEVIPQLDVGSKRIYELYTLIDTFLDSALDDAAKPYFVDYLTQRVYLFEIGVPGEQDGHKVFVTMNDRGLKLSPIDLLKGYLLSAIEDDSRNKIAHTKWNECIRTLRELGSDEDSAFFKTWLRAKYAGSIRGKEKGDKPGDFENIGDGYHRWVADNKDRLGLNNSDDYFNLVTSTIPFFVELYIKIKKAEKQFDEHFSHVYFNGSRDLTLQTMVIAATVKQDDTASDADKKIRAISYYLDYFAAARTINGKENTYDNIRDLVFNIARSVRDKPIADIQVLIEGWIDKFEEKIDTIGNVNFNDLKRQDLLQILARVGHYLEDGAEQTNRVSFPNYIDRRRGTKTFDVEHVLPNKPKEAMADLGANE